MPRGQMSAEKRQKATSAGGRARAAALSDQERATVAAAGAAAVNSPVGLAKRLVKKWPGLDEAERAEVLEVLVAGLPLQTKV